MCKRYIYLRVSTDSQGFDQQMQDIKAYGIKPDEVDGIVEEHESGGKSYVDREFNKLLKRCEPGDYIYAATTSRLGRSFIDMIKLMEDAKNRGVIIVACHENISLDDRNPMAKMFLAMSAIWDEDERMRIKHRTANKKAWQREQIAKHGYFIIENGPNKGKRCTYVGSPKGEEMSENQKNALTKAREASSQSRADTAIAWRENSRAVKFALRKRAEGWGVTQITDELGKLFDDSPEIYCTPIGCKPTKGHVSRWISEANPLTLA